MKLKFEAETKEQQNYQTSTRVRWAEALMSFISQWIVVGSLWHWMDDCPWSIVNFVFVCQHAANFKFICSTRLQFIFIFCPFSLLCSVNWNTNFCNAYKLIAITISIIISSIRMLCPQNIFSLRFLLMKIFDHLQADFQLIAV